MRPVGRPWPKLRRTGRGPGTERVPHSLLGVTPCLALCDTFEGESFWSMPRLSQSISAWHCSQLYGTGRLRVCGRLAAMLADSASKASQKQKRENSRHFGRTGCSTPQAFSNHTGKEAMACWSYGRCYISLSPSQAPTPCCTRQRLKLNCDGVLLWSFWPPESHDRSRPAYLRDRRAEQSQEAISPVMRGCTSATSAAESYLQRVLPSFTG